MVVHSDAEVRGSDCQRIRADVVAVLEGGYDLDWTRNPDGSLAERNCQTGCTIGFITSSDRQSIGLDSLPVEAGLSK